MKKKLTPAKRFNEQVGKLRFKQYTERKAGKTIASRSTQALEHASSMAAMPRQVGVKKETIRQHKTLGGGCVSVNACVRENPKAIFTEPDHTPKSTVKRLKVTLTADNDGVISEISSATVTADTARLWAGCTDAAEIIATLLPDELSELIDLYIDRVDNKAFKGGAMRIILNDVAYTFQHEITNP